MSIDWSLANAEGKIRVTFEGRVTNSYLVRDDIVHAVIVTAAHSDKKFGGPGEVGVHVAIPHDAIVSVEDAPLALPTEPGTRFWGKTNDSEPQWWFVQQVVEGVWYIPASHERVGDVEPDKAERISLTRLPDPEETP